MDGDSFSALNNSLNSNDPDEHELIVLDNEDNEPEVELQSIGQNNNPSPVAAESQVAAEDHQALLRRQVLGEENHQTCRVARRCKQMDNHQSQLRQQALLPETAISGENSRINDNLATSTNPTNLSTSSGATVALSSTSFLRVQQQQEETATMNRNSYYEEQRRELSNQQRAPELSTPSPMNAPSSWSLVPSSVGCPCERSLCSACVWNDSLYLFGGYNGQARVNDFHRYHFESQHWTSIPPVGQVPSARDRHVSVVYGYTFYVFGGFDGAARTNDFFGFDFQTMTWNAVVQSNPPPSERHSHSAAVHDHCMYVYGGYDGSYKSDLHQFDFRSQQWTTVSTSGRHPRARYRATAVVSDKSQMVLFGGHDGTRHLNDIHILDLDTLQWSAPSFMNPPTPRDSHVSVVYNGSVFVFGGSSGTAMNDLHELSLTTMSSSSTLKWKPVKMASSNNTSAESTTSITATTSPEASPNFCPRPRFCHVAVVYQDAMYVFGGYDGQERLDDFWRFDFAQRDEIPPSTLINDLQAMVNDDTCSDITFVVEDGAKEVYAHKIMLLRCSYFRALLLGGMVESRLNKIPLPEVRYETLLQVLEFLYTDNINFRGNDLESAMELYQAADLFMIGRLQKMCERQILNSLNVENAATLFHYSSDVVAASVLREKSLSFILTHFEAVSKTVAFEEMGRANMELVFEVLRNR